MIEIKQLSKTFSIPKNKKKKKQADAVSDPREDGKLFRALVDVSFTARNGKITGLLGSNGAGKTTLLRILATSLKPTGGTATVDGTNIVKGATDVRRKVGFLSGNTGLYGRLSPHELLTFFGRMYGIPVAALDQRIAQLLDELQLTPYAHRRCDLLSAGMKQKVSIARSLIHNPSVIIFDEPTTGLDVSSAQGILGYVEQCRSAGKTILFSTHHMHEVEKLCDWVVIMRHGLKCFEGTVEQMRMMSGQEHLDDAYLTLSGEGGARTSTELSVIANRRRLHVG
jgi:sodium transport system ATP-binding protein